MMYNKNNLIKLFVKKMEENLILFLWLCRDGKKKEVIKDTIEIDDIKRSYDKIEVENDDEEFFNLCIKYDRDCLVREVLDNYREETEAELKNMDSLCSDSDSDLEYNVDEYMSKKLYELCEKCIKNESYKLLTFLLSYWTELTGDSIFICHLVKYCIRMNNNKAKEIVKGYY